MDVLQGKRARKHPELRVFHNLSHPGSKPIDFAPRSVMGGDAGHRAEPNYRAQIVCQAPWSAVSAVPLPLHLTIPKRADSRLPHPPPDMFSSEQSKVRDIRKLLRSRRLEPVPPGLELRYGQF